MVNYSLKVGTFYRLSLLAPIKMCSKFILYSTLDYVLKMVGKWLMADSVLSHAQLLTDAFGTYSLTLRITPSILM